MSKHIEAAQPRHDQRNGPLGFVVSVSFVWSGRCPSGPSSQSCCGRSGHDGELLAPLLLYRKLGPIVRLGLELPLPTGQGALVVCRAYFLVCGFAHCPCPLPFSWGCRTARRVPQAQRARRRWTPFLPCAMDSRSPSPRCPKAPR